MVSICNEWAMIKVGHMELHKYINREHQHDKDMQPYQITSGPEIPIFGHLALCILSSPRLSIIETQNGAEEQTQYHGHLEGIPGYQSRRCRFNNGESVSYLYGYPYIKMAYFHFIYLNCLFYSFSEGSIYMADPLVFSVLRIFLILSHIATSIQCCVALLKPNKFDDRSLMRSRCCDFWTLHSFWSATLVLAISWLMDAFCCCYLLINGSLNPWKPDLELLILISAKETKLNSEFYCQKIYT